MAGAPEDDEVARDEARGHPFRDRLLLIAARWARERPWTVVLAALVTALAAGALAIRDLRINANTDDLIDPERPYMKDYRAFVDEFGDLEGITVVIERPADPAAADALTEELAAKLRAIPTLESVHHSVRAADQRRLSLPAMTDEQLADFASARRAYPAWLIDGDGGAILEDAHQKTNRLLSPIGALANAEELGAAVYFSLELFADRDGAPADVQGGIDDLTRELPPQYFDSETGRLRFIEIEARKDYGTMAVIEEPLRAIRATIDEVAAKHPGVRIGLTGKPVLQADEMDTTNRDMTLASIVALFIVAGLFVFMIGGLWWPGTAMIALLFGIAWTFGLTTVMVGQLNLLSIVFTSILVGIGNDFGVHVITRFQEELRRRPLGEAITQALLTSGKGNFSAAMTSSAAFFMTLFTDFQGLRELGLIAGCGLMLCLLAMTLVLPAMLVLLERKRPGAGEARPLASRLFGAASRLRPPRPGRQVMVLALVTIASLPFLSRVTFDGNVLELQAEGLDSVDWEHRILEDSASASWFAAIPIPDEAGLPERLERARAESATIGAIHSIDEFVRPRRAERDERIRRVLAAEPPGKRNREGPWTADDLRVSAADARRLAAAARTGRPEESDRLEGLARRLEKSATAVESDPLARSRIVERIAALRGNLAAMFAGARLWLEGGPSLGPLLPEDLRRRYVSPRGTLLLALHPRENVWDQAAMQRFVEAVRRVDPRATGVPMTHSLSIRDMTDGFVRAALLALGAVVVIVLLDFRRLVPSLLSLVPLVIGFIWLIAGMGMAGLHFNLANFFSVPILIGLGVDGGIHVMHRFREGGADRFGLGSTRRSVILTNLTSVAGFGTLLLAQHRGLMSLGLVMALGCLSCLAATLFVLPPLLRLFDRRRSDPDPSDRR